MTESILDKVISSQKSAAAQSFNPQATLTNLLQDLKQREMEVISLRYGLEDNIKRTLEEIGNKFGVTRERIRQIENTALKRIKKLEHLEEHLKSLEIIVNQLLESYGGVMSEHSLIKKVVSIPGEEKGHFSATEFILSKLLNEKLHYLPENEKFHSAWKLPTVSLEQVEEIVENIIKVIAEANAPLTVSAINNLVKEKNVAVNWPVEPDEQIINSLLEISKKVSTNPFNEWGLADWENIALKRMSDKIYLVLQKEGKPMHFTAIAQKINEIGFDGKKANPATIHNELILDKKYVLVGRGIYALAEWGFKPGVVADVIAEIIKEAKKPLSREEIIEAVSSTRMVKRSTIILALMNKNKFKRDENGKYSLVTL